jgi:protein-S-isoprenylcysteine O-methyltransferase Ste14
MFNLNVLVIILTLVIITIKVVWIRTELKFSKERFNMAMFKTNAVEALILAFQTLAAYVTPLPKTAFNGYITVLGIEMFIIGVVLVFWARHVMQQSWGVPGEHAKKQNSLVTSGPFAFSRNPIYVGFALLYLGFAIAIQSWLIILRIPLLIYFYKSAVKEEKLLEKMFGEKYLKYKFKVPRFL